MHRQKQIIDGYNANQYDYFDDLADLQARLPNPRMGEYAVVGKKTDLAGTTPGVLYMWDSKRWLKIGPVSSVVYKAASEASEVEKINVYPKAADIGAAPTVVSGAVYSTFTEDAGTLNSFISNKAVTAWVSIASGGVETFKVTLSGAAIAGVNTIVSGTTSVVTLPVTSGQVISTVTVKTGTGSVSILDPFKGLVAVAGSTALDLEKTEVAATAPASADPGVYTGFATTFAALPTTRKNATALVVGDWALLPVIDGTHLPGIYKWDGSAWVMDTSFSDDETSGATLPDPNTATYGHFLLFGSVDSLNGWYRREGTAGAHYWIQVTSAQKASLDLWGKGADLPNAATTDMVAFLKTSEPSRGFYERVNNYWVMVLGS